MHAVVVRVLIDDFDRGRQFLTEQVVQMMESQPPMDDGVTIEGIEVREVVANA